MNKITEEWARTAPAGAELDRVCAEWMGHLVCHYVNDMDGVREGISYRPWDGATLSQCDSQPLPYSTSWSAAGPLLEAMNRHRGIWSLAPRWVMLPYSVDSLKHTGGFGGMWPRATDPCLAIARACAVLVARGVAREEVSR